MTTLTATARTILRSRMRRHADLASVLPADETVATLKNADLVQAAMLLGLTIPTMGECDAYTKAKDAGENPIEAADPLPLDTPATSATSTMPATPDMTEAERKAKAQATTDALFARMGTGDFVGFKEGVLALAIDALKPAEIKTVVEVKTVVKDAPVFIDPAKVKGHIAQVTGTKTAAQMGMGTFHGLDAGKVSMAVYDAPDAPRIDNDYRWPTSAAAVLAALSRGRSAFLYGPAGTGKTSFAKQVAAHSGRSYVRISCTETTEAETLVGMTVPDASNGGVKWQDGQLTAAIRRPGTLVHIDEVTVARPGALFVLQSLLDDERAIFIAETGEFVPMAPGVIVIITDNTNGTGDVTGQYEATRIMNRAFLDRCAVTARLDFMTPAEEAKALVARSGCKPKLAALLCKFAALTRTKADQGRVSHGLTLRRLIALAEALTDGVDPNFAYQLTVIETAPHDDKEPLRQLWTADMNATAISAAVISA